MKGVYVVPLYGSATRLSFGKVRCKIVVMNSFLFVRNVRKALEYRREIDGLRAVAVLPVILFHAGFNAFSGGFVGVDVFFVISGYLITTIILAEKEKGTFSLVTFYERRARRILPALLFVMLCCLPFAWLWLLPNHLEDFSKSLIAVSAFSSNILFWQESGYFATAAELKPLLHMWSLAVEEQYYVIFPLFLILVWKLRKRWIFGSLIIIAIASLTLAQWGSYNQPSATFFLLPTRLWELAIGALIAFYFIYKKDHTDFIKSNKAINEILGALGISLILYSIFAFDNTTPFPSFYALIPTIGTGLIIIFTTPQTFAGRLLGTKTMVGIGLISYSTYLWHQPLFVFARHRSLTGLSVPLLLTLAFFSLVLGYLSWRFVERPFRDKETFNRKKIFNFAIASSITFALVGMMGTHNNGWASRVPSGAYKLFNEARNNTTSLESSQLIPNKYGGKINNIIYLVGDSFAAQLSTSLSREAHLKNVAFGESFLHGCPPVLGVKRQLHEFECSQYNEITYRGIREEDKIKTVILAANWTGYIEEHHQGRRGLLKRYVTSIEELLLTGKTIALIYPFPAARQNVPDFILKSSFLYGEEVKEMSPHLGSTSYEKYEATNRAVYSAFDSIKDRANLIRVFPEKIFCNSFVSDRCVVQYNGKIFYSDGNHLSEHGSDLVAKEIFRQIDNHQINRQLTSNCKSSKGSSDNYRN